MQVNFNKDINYKQRREIISKYENGPTKNKNDNWENPQYSVYATTDYYGFIHDGGMSSDFLGKENKIKKLDRKRETKWRKLLFSKDKVSKHSRSSGFIKSESSFGNISSRMNDSSFMEELKKRIYKGIPKQFKSSIWHAFLDIGIMKNSKPGVYQKMLQKALEKSPDVHQIDLDVNRTFRNTTYFRERYNDRQNALLHVLAAYSMYNTEIGYCQGMSEIAGLLLMYLVDEEDVFWGLSQLMTSSRYCMHGMFVIGFPRLMTFFNHLNTIIHKLLPKISKHFEKLEVMVSSYALKWFMQCYLDRVPLTLFLRLWDIFLLEGEKLLIAMAYNILKMQKKRLIRMDHGTILQFFQNDLKKDFLYEDDLVIESLKNCLEELKRHKLSVPSPQGNELPCRPFGTDYDFHTPSPNAVKERQKAQANPAESIRRSIKMSRSPEGKPSIRQNSSDKDRSVKDLHIENNRPKHNDSSTQTKMVNNDRVSPQRRYRIVHQNSKINKSTSLILSAEEMKNEEIRDGHRQSSKKITSSENRSRTKSVPDLLNGGDTLKAFSVTKIKKHDHNQIHRNDESPSTKPNVPATTTTPSTTTISNKLPSNSDSNHVPVSSRNSISKSKTISSLYLSQARPTKRRPLSTSPETIL